MRRSDNISPDAITLAEAAMLLGVSAASARRYLDRGDLVGWKLGPDKRSPLRVSRASVERYLRANVRPV